MLYYWLRHWGWENCIFVVVVGLLAAAIALVFKHYGSGAK